MTKFSALFLIFYFPLYAYTQQTDSIPENTLSPIKSFIIPASLIGYGVFAKGDGFFNKIDRSIQRRIHTNVPDPSEIPEDILRYIPALSVYALNLSGIRGKNDLVDASGIFLLSNVIMGGAIESTKRITERSRPDASDNRSFPSGHTGSAFASAEFLKQEYKDISPLYGYAGYTIATATGVLRLRHNKHWFGDVVAGAGFGIISTKVAYLLYPEIKKIFKSTDKIEYSLIPNYQQEVFGLSFNARF